MENHQLLNDVYEKVAEINNELYKIWNEVILFSWRWWLSIALSIIPWILWVKYRERENSTRLFVVGLVVALTTNVFDIVGLSFHLWHYDWKLFPVIPVYFPWDFTLFPVIIMFSLQVKPHINVLLKALIFSIFSAFMMEPLFDWLGLYDPIQWKHTYSFFIYIPLYIFFNYVYNSKIARGSS